MASMKPIFVRFELVSRAEEVGLEPTTRFLHEYSLANWWLAIRRTPPSIFILPQKSI